jgi:hypothetical protein
MDCTRVNNETTRNADISLDISELGLQSCEVLRSAQRRKSGSSEMSGV